MDIEQTNEFSAGEVEMKKKKKFSNSCHNADNPTQNISAQIDFKKDQTC